MKYLFVHTNYPSQFRRLAPALREQGNEVVFLAENQEWHAPSSHEGIRLKAFKKHRDGGNEYLHPYLRRLDQAIILGQAVFKACTELANEGWKPDWIINHVGFGCGLYLNDAFPKAKRAALVEWYYNSYGSDVDFINKGTVEADRQLRLRTWNAQTLLELAHVDIAITPTKWQRNQFPKKIQKDIQVIHEGIQWGYLSEIKENRNKKPDCVSSIDNCEIITYVSRGFEEYRGFPQAMKALAEVQKVRPQAQVLIAGNDITAYGPSRSDGRSWGTWAKEEAKLDPKRTHWLGPLQEMEYHQLLAWSDVHLYLTVPFVLSWSLLEAMATGCSIVASNTKPVQEVMSNNKEGLLVDFYDVGAQAKAIVSLLVDKERANALGMSARAASKSYDSTAGIAKWGKALSGSQYQIG